MKWIGDKTTFIDSTDSNENGSNPQETNVYSNVEAYVPTVSATEAIGIVIFSFKIKKPELNY